MPSATPAILPPPPWSEGKRTGRDAHISLNRCLTSSKLVLEPSWFDDRSCCGPVGLDVYERISLRAEEMLSLASVKALVTELELSEKLDGFLYGLDWDDAPLLASGPYGEGSWEVMT